MIMQVLHCLEDLGLLCALEAVQVCLENGFNVVEECEFYAKASLKCKTFLQEVLSIISSSFQNGGEYLWDTLCHCSIAVSMSYVSPKLYELLEIFESFGDVTQMQCLIFVDRIITAEVIVRIMKKINFLSHLSFAYVTGNSISVGALSPSVQKSTLDLFCSGKINLLFATDVVEEGMDILTCCYVIRFDLPKAVCSYIQSRGRARQKDSQFVLMLEREQIFNISRSEYSMTNTAINRNPDAYFIKPCTMNDRDSYTVEGTGASVTLDSSVVLIHQYCQKLTGDKHFVPKPNFQFLAFETSYKCKITLPPNAAFQTLLGPLGANVNLSKQLVCFEACKKLHEMGALNDHLLPVVEIPWNNDSMSKGSSSGAGTTKRKELHGTTPVRALSGTWHENKDSRVFHAYTMHFSCSVPEERFSSFVLLLDTKLDEDVGNVEFDLYLVSKFVRSSVAYCGEMRLDSEQVVTAMCFQELVFNGLFGKLFVRSKSSKERNFLLQMEESLWDPSYTYLLLPLVSFASSTESPEIDWHGINSCASVVEFMKKNARLCNTRSSDEKESLPNLRVDIIDNDNNKTNVLYFANKTVDMENVAEMVVLAIHTGKMYSIVKVVDDTNSESAFDGNSEGSEPLYSSYFEYFNKKYGIVLKHPGQPMLRLKQSHNAHNLLVEFRSEEGVSSEKDLEEIYKKVVKKAQFHVHIPPELLVVIDMPISIVKSFYLLPSMMHRLESLMLASQLRAEISCPTDSDFRISSSLILEALTTMRCNEVFSLERLELLGDSVLKYAVSCHLYLKYPKKNEGQLSAQRSWAVCNSTLHKRGTDRKLQGYIQDAPFDPRRWIAPGQQTMRPYPCSCGVDSLEVPLDSKFQSNNPNIMIRKCCDMGHRWMVSKTISDCVEGLIGAYYTGGGLVAALHLMTWLGIEAEFDPWLLDEAIRTASLHTYVPKERDIQALEAKIGYVFTTKGLLLEAITHGSYQETAVTYCYQRLEFLGDSVLDILITRHLYQRHAKIDPGELTDLRSASVNNENFAHAAIRKDLHPHLQHCSGFLLSQITEFVKSVSSFNNTTDPLPNAKVPKVLGDLVESIAGAILVDTKLDLEEVWRIYEPLLSPIVTPDKLELPPLRELIELCESLGYFVKENCVSRGETVHAELRLQLRDVLLIGEGVGPNKKIAKGRAASQLLKDLESRGISNSKRSKQGSDAADISSPMDTDGNNASPPVNIHSAPKTCDPIVDIPVLQSVIMKKGGPRSFLYELCKKKQWPVPTFDTEVQKSRTPIEFFDGSETRTGFNSFTSTISLTIPEYGTIELTGDPRADKKSSYDSAAIFMLHELQRNGKLEVGV